MNSKSISAAFIWAILALPSILMLISFVSEPSSAERMLHPSGEFAARFMIIAMMITPIRMLFPKARFLVWIAKRRRWIGVAAFGYAVLHTVFYVVDMGSIQLIVDEFWALGIWTGWGAFAIFVPLAVTSNNASQRWLLGRWKQVQRFIYPAAILTLIHWIFVHNNIGPAMVHFLPLAILEVYRICKTAGAQRPTNISTKSN